MQLANQDAPAAAAGTRVAMKQRAYDELKRRILSGELPPGAVLSVRQLAADMNMSKTPVHSAFERLETNGFVTLAPQQGVVVRESSVEDIVNHFEMRQALEPFVAKRLAGTLQPQQAERLRENIAEHRKLCERGELDALIRADAEFHRLLCSFLGNAEITRAMSQLQDKVYRAIYQLARQFPFRVAKSCDEHESIFAALVSGDGELAARLVHEHLNDGLQCFWQKRRQTDDAPANLRRTNKRQDNA
jgi:DNA-binding GntR family transcriptional regulator